jgi:hypothetical protein
MRPEVTIHSQGNISRYSLAYAMVPWLRGVEHDAEGDDDHRARPSSHRHTPAAGSTSPKSTLLFNRRTVSMNAAMAAG